MIKLLPILLLMLCTRAAAEQGLVDPTRPYISKHATVMQKEGPNVAGDSRLKVTAIFISQQHRRAIINGKNYYEGQTVFGNKILSIEQNRVVLGDADGSQELLMNKNNIKKDITNGF
ncbi:MAG: hypothetical protein ACI965_000434 [Paraglaciecola sp.]|jgi:hypothetical protein